MQDATNPTVGLTTAEGQRLASLRRLAILDTLPDPVFDAITAAAAQTCRSPIALVSLIDDHRQWFKSNIGLPGVHETARDVAFCDHAIRGPALFEIADAALDARFASNPLVTGDPHIRFYAGAPIVLQDGARIGTVCVIDRAPRALSDDQRATLMSLSAIAGAALEAAGQQARTRLELAAKETQYRAIVEDQSELISLAGKDRVLSFVNTAYARHFGLEAQQMIGRDLLDFVTAADREDVRRHWAAVCVQTEATPGTNRMRSADGVDRWVAWTNRPLLGPAGEVVAVQSVGREITAQKMAEQALEASERRYRSLYEATPAILHSLDSEGRLINVSDYWLAVMGYRRDEVIGRRSSEFLTPDSQRKATEEILPAFFRTGHCENVEYQFVRRDGSLIDVELSGTLERDADGKPVRSLAVLRDVTEARRVALELSRTHKRLDAIVENVPAMLGYWGADRTTQFVNREFQAAIGLPPENIIGRPLGEVFDAVDPPATVALSPYVDRVLEGRRQEFELAMITTSGLRQLRASLIPDQPEVGRVNGFYGVAHDITGLKALELRLIDSEQRYRSLFDNLNSGFALHEVIVNPAGRVTDYRYLAMNAAFSAMTGLAPETSIGRRITEVLPGTEDDPADWIGVFGRVALTGEPKHFEQRSAIMERWFEVVAYRPAPGQFAVIAIDITKRKEAEADLREAYQEKETLLEEVRSLRS